MAKQVSSKIKLQIPAGQASPAPPVGPALGQHGIDIMSFVKEFNARTADEQDGVLIPVEIEVYADRSFSFETKTPPASVLLKQAAGIETAAGNSLEEVAGTVNKDQLREIAEMKMKDLNAASMEAAMRIIAGTARSMGIMVEEED